jgi:predicted MFS family arabinose efflux permease
MTQGSPRPVAAAALLTAMVAASFGFGIYLFPALLPDMQAELGFGYDMAGLATAVAQGGFFLASLASAMLASRLGPTRVATLALLAAALVLAGLALVGSVPLLVAGLFVLAGAAGLGWTPVAEIVQATVPERHRGMALGLISSGTSYGVFLNGLLAPPVLAAAGWRTVWLVVAALAFLLLAAFAWGFRHVRPAPPAKDRPTLRHPGDGGNHALPLLLAIMFATGLACAPFQTYLAGLLREDGGWDGQAAARIWSTLGMAGMVGGIAMGWLADRVSVQRSLVLAMFVLLLATLGMTAPAHHALVHLAVAGFGAAFMAIFGLVPTYLARIAQGARTTRLSGAANMALAVGNTAGNLSGGMLRESAGCFLPVYGAIAAVALGLLVLAILLPNERQGLPLRKANKTLACS